MIFVPYRKYVFLSALSSSGVLARLVPRVERGVRSGNGREEFHGTVAEGGFRVYRMIRGRNTYLPWLRGRVMPVESGGCRVSVVSSPHPVAIAIVAAFCFGAAYSSGKI